MNNVKEVTSHMDYERGIRKFRIKEDMGGHDGVANGGHYGPWTNVIGVFPDNAIVIGPEKEGAVHRHSAKMSRTNFHHDTFERSYQIFPENLRQNDWIAIEKGNTGLAHNSRGDGIEILAHKLPIAELPEDWQPIGGNTRSNWYSYHSCSKYSLLCTKTGQKISFEKFAAFLGLEAVVHPYGSLWMYQDRPVAMNEQPIWTSGRDTSNHQDRIFGDLDFIHDQGYVVLNENEKDTQYGTRYSTNCSQQVVFVEEPISNLKGENGWYPIQITDHMVVWGTGLNLYPKHLQWNIGVDFGGKIFDTSADREQRVINFFKEKINFPSNDPFAVYEDLANEADPRNGKWSHGYHYPKNWQPKFSGWDITMFPYLECRWKQPENGTSRYYGVVK